MVRTGDVPLPESGTLPSVSRATRLRLSDAKVGLGLGVAAGCDTFDQSISALERTHSSVNRPSTSDLMGTVSPVRRISSTRRTSLGRPYLYFASSSLGRGSLMRADEPRVRV